MDFIAFHSDVDTVEYDLFTLPAQKWHWKARLSALYFSQNIPTNHRYEIIFTTSVLNLAELIGMRSDLAQCQKIVYFHENQLIYPVREMRDRDCQYGLNQIMTWFVKSFKIMVMVVVVVLYVQVVSEFLRRLCYSLTIVPFDSSLIEQLSSRSHRIQFELQQNIISH